MVYTKRNEVGESKGMKSARSSLLWEIYEEHCWKATGCFLKSCEL